MALVKYGGGIVQMSGSIAGNTHARNRYGNYVRARTKPVNPNSARQQEIRNAITECTDRWGQTLTALQRAAWNLYADNVAMKNKLGEAIHLSGFNHYIRSQSWARARNQATNDVAPVIFELAEKDPTFNITISEGTQQVSVIFDIAMDWCIDDGAILWFFEGQPQNAQRNFFKGPWKYNNCIPGNSVAPPASPVVVATVNPVSEGQHIWYNARILRSDNRMSETMYADTFCAA